ncbi:glycosyltransferase family 2 protein [Humidisolicoccus flavus]|uniref:glycosyltransferase family 2 protein n=1 Tax=Humidisolicoccus flavus TaxID=3111414 RepID=UPI00324CA0A6
MQQPRVSVALCTYNGAQWLEEQIRSILAQTVPVFEIVVGDDNSSDETLAILERLRSTSKIPIVVRAHKPALGTSANFLDAIHACSGEVVALSDQDDVWHERKIEQMLPLFEDPNVLLVHSDARLVDGSGRPLRHSLAESLEMNAGERAGLERGDALEILLRRNLVTGATVLLRRTLAESVQTVPDAWVHDEWLALIAASRGGLRFLPLPLIDYRQHETNQIGVSKPGLRVKITKLLGADPARIDRIARRGRSLAAALRECELFPEIARRKLQQKAEHMSARAALPRRRFARLVPVIRLSRDGRYRSYTRGHIDIARDLFEMRTFGASSGDNVNSSYS